MDNILLGKVLKSMQKLSGKSIGELADASGLTVDTINNLFYARVQKPGFMGVCRLTECMGFSVTDLLYFLQDKSIQNLDVPQITEAVAAYTNAETKPFADTAKPAAASAKEIAAGAKEQNALGLVHEDAKLQMQKTEELYEKQFDRYRAANSNYVEQMRRQYESQIQQMQTSYENSVKELEKLFDEQAERQVSVITQYERQSQEAHQAYLDTANQKNRALEHVQQINNRLLGIVISEAVVIGLLVFFLTRR